MQSTVKEVNSGQLLQTVLVGENALERKGVSRGLVPGVHTARSLLGGPLWAVLPLLLCRNQNSGKA